MSVWNYNDNPHDVSLDIIGSQKCLFCKIPLSREDKFRGGEDEHETLIIFHCKVCGWWSAEYYEQVRLDLRDCAEIKKASYGILKKLDLSNIKQPIQEVRDYLSVKSESIKTIHPKMMEDVVGSIFSNLGYRSFVTNYSGDNGIDVILYDNNSNLIGVQVKREKNKISASQIRELTGALFLGKYTRGIFVTTSNFQPGALKTAQISEQIGMPIELMDYKRFFDALQIAQLAIPRESLTWEDYRFKQFRQFGYQGFYCPAK